MITGIFILQGDRYCCSNQVELKSSSMKSNAIRETTIFAKSCFTIGQFPYTNQMIQGVIKYENSPSMNFKGVIKTISPDKNLQINIASEFRIEGTEEILTVIASLL